MLLLLAGLLNLPAALPSLADEVKDDNTRRCITTRNLKSTRVVNDLNILFYMVGKTVYHNILPRQCKGLARYGSFSYRTTAGSLCSSDSIQILQGNSALGGRHCRLGSFHRITKEDADEIIKGPDRPPMLNPPPPADVEDIIKESDQPQSSTPK